MKTMRDVLRILENADFDYRENDASELHDFDYKEFSSKGRADLPTRGVYPRADNALADGHEDELIIDIQEDAEDQSVEPDPVQLDRLRQILNSELRQSDEAIRRGPLHLDNKALQSIAGRLGISIADVQALNNTLTQKMRDQQGDEEENKLLLTSLGEEYRRMMQEIEPPAVLQEAGHPERPFPASVGETRFYAEQPDSLGNITVWDSETGTSKFLQGGQATELRDRLAKTQDKDAVLAPLFERASNPEGGESYDKEIAANSGTYNFPWHLGPHHGFATAFFNDKQDLRLLSVLDMAGEPIALDRLSDAQHKDLLQQARQFVEQGDV